MEGAELIDTTSNTMDRLLQYLDNNLTTLHDNLNEDNFERVLLVIWDIISETLYQLVNNNLEVLAESFPTLLLDICILDKTFDQSFLPILLFIFLLLLLKYPSNVCTFLFHRKGDRHRFTPISIEPCTPLFDISTSEPTKLRTLRF